MKTIIKRDGSRETFDSTKIVKAIKGAEKDLGLDVEGLAEKTTEKILAKLEKKGREEATVEEIQDMVEDQLMCSGYKNVAKQYIKYRYQRHIVRDFNTTDQQIFELISGNSEYWNNENSNKDARSVTTQRDYIAGITNTDIARRFIFPKEVIEAHDEGIIHLHDIDYAADYVRTNCFSGETKFITDKGVKNFKDFYDGDKVKVLDKDGVWREATVKTYGKQRMYDVTLQSGRTVKTITCTENHRWILKNGNVTTKLEVGDKLWLLKDSRSFNWENMDDEEIQAFTFGFVLGDGSEGTHKKGLRVRLCGEKTKYAAIFEKAGYIITPIKNSDDLCATNKKEYSKQLFLNSEGWRLLPFKQKIALFNGYYAADGAKDRNQISTADKRLLSMIKSISALAGYHIASIKEEIKNKNYKENAYLATVSFMVSQPECRNWTVKEIIPHKERMYKDYRRENCFYKHSNPIVAWCVEEPITHSFTLEGGIVTGNCCLVNLNDMLQNGTVLNGIKIERPKRFITASTIATQIILGVSAAQYGGTTITLSHLAPFVRDSYYRYYNKYIERGLDEKQAEKFAREDTRREVKDGVQTFNYQVNSMASANGQSPFISVNMYLGETDEYKEELAVIIEEFLLQRIEGMKNKQGVWITVAFPKLLYVLEEDNIRPGTKYWYLTELAAKCTAKRMVPDYISEKMMKQLKINRLGEGDCYPCMGCRSFLTPDNVEGNVAKALDYDPNKGKYYGRFNCGVCTINLADIAFSSKGDYDKFWKLFEERTELCHLALKTRIKRIANATSDVAPILWQNGAFARLEPGEKLEKLVYGGYSTVSLGYAALYECVKYMTGHSHTEPEGREFGLKVMQALNDKCNQWKVEENAGYSLYGTPIESTTYKFAKLLKKRFGEDVFVKLDGKDRNYITNSYHVPVFEEIFAFDKLEKEAEFQKLSPGGAISYIETPDMTHNIMAVEQVIQYIYDTIMYAELNTKSDYCQECGYDGEIKIIDEGGQLKYKCPNCGNTDSHKMNVARRVCGYISTTIPNQGRLDEIAHRVVHLDTKEENL